jgi:hypothetical protein
MGSPCSTSRVDGELRQPAGPNRSAMTARARMFRRWADNLPDPAAQAARRRACELTLMAEVAAAAG